MFGKTTRYLHYQHFEGDYSTNISGKTTKCFWGDSRGLRKTTRYLYSRCLMFSLAIVFGRLSYVWKDF